MNNRNEMVQQAKKKTYFSQRYVSGFLATFALFIFIGFIGEDFSDENCLLSASVFALCKALLSEFVSYFTWKMLIYLGIVTEEEREALKCFINHVFCMAFIQASSPYWQERLFVTVSTVLLFLIFHWILGLYDRSRTRTAENIGSLKNANPDDVAAGRDSVPVSNDATGGVPRDDSIDSRRPPNPVVQLAAANEVANVMDVPQRDGRHRALDALAECLAEDARIQSQFDELDAQMERLIAAANPEAAELLRVIREVLFQARRH